MADTDPHEATQKMPANESRADEEESSAHPERVGRYRIERLLGKGGFGLVYLAHDEQLDRRVAVKVPHAKLIEKPEDAEAYLSEARTVANLDHPGIVPVHDVGSTDECPCYVVSKYIEGADLSATIKERRLNHRESAEVVATVAEALHYAHKQGLVHRDVKPGNILIDGEHRPFVVDFGLALREENIGTGPKYAGTPVYMSPEQARGEGHRVDGRSDIFSLGAVFYELLTGRRPFSGETVSDTLNRIASQEPKPPRQIEDVIPKELERICLMALSKRASERYTTAMDMAEDLRVFLAEHPSVLGSSPTSVGETQGGSDSTQVPFDSSKLDTAGQPIRVVPKGLRSFDAHDADFFLELLPGARDREGLPESLRFWKTRILETDPDNTFSVGLIYGPSGCGKSSLVKAGLLPRLPDTLTAVYVESTPDETESRLLHGLRKRCPGLPDNLGLKDALAALRRAEGTPAGQKVLIVLDQFEQWLHANRDSEGTDLVRALRQCDGGSVQCIVMVRDDFWMAATRFMRELEIRLVEAQNSAPVDLFPMRHAEKVLAAFGRAFGALPDYASRTTKDQREFVRQSAAGLSDDGKVICVRLALFAEMMKGREWTPASLKEVGGTAGIGVTFLEETFGASTSPPEHRYHQKAARSVLKALLPESGTDIKGQMKSRDELLETSGYTNRPGDFDDLIRILDSEIRLITPTDPEGKDAVEDSVSQVEAGQKYYQLAHDYLVHSLRDWLTRKQRETRRGRAELRLTERAALWNAKPENRHLPTWWEYANIRLLTEKKNWSRPQRKMMGKAGRVHALRSALVLAALVAGMFGGIAIRSDAEASRIVEGLGRADTSQIKTIIENLADYRQYARDDLQRVFAESPPESNARLHAALAMLPEDKSVLPMLRDRLLTVTPVQFEYVRDLLEDDRDSLVAAYWKTAQNDERAAVRFQAACALATYSPINEHWRDEEFRTFLASHLVGVRPSELEPWINALRPVREHLVAPLSMIYADSTAGEQVRSFATETLADYLSEDAPGLFDLLADGTEKQFGVIIESLNSHREKAIELGKAEVAMSCPEDASEEDKEALAMRQANAAVLLLRMGAADPVWPLLKHSPDPRVRSYIIHWLGPRGGDPQAIMARYETEPDVTIKRALLLCLGEFDLAETDKQPLIEKLLTVYRSDPDAGLHAAAEWLLRHWEHGEELADIDKELQQNEAQLVADEDNRRPWYINTQGQTFVVLDAGEFSMGSPEGETDRQSGESLHRRRIGRRIAMATKEVTHEQWRVFSQANPEMGSKPDQEQLKAYVRSDDSPMLAMTWFEAAWYCNWLSAQEGISDDQWCYEKNEKDEYGPGMKAREKFWELSGYRLPTEAEWEHACRAGASTSRYYGVTESLLPSYAWYLANGDNHTHPAASLKPNDYGLFDMQGNVWEWCWDAFADYPASSGEAVSDAPSVDSVDPTGRRVVRGGGFNYLPSFVRSAYRFSFLPAHRLDMNGFRPVRTYNLSR